jgi:hypothetical protein
MIKAEPSLLSIVLTDKDYEIGVSSRDTRIQRGTGGSYPRLAPIEKDHKSRITEQQIRKTLSAICRSIEYHTRRSDMQSQRCDCRSIIQLLRGYPSGSLGTRRMALLWRDDAQECLHRLIYPAYRNNVKWTTRLKKHNERLGERTVRMTERREATHREAITSILKSIIANRGKISSLSERTRRPHTLVSS